jgi:hypothetical protein
MFEYHDAATAVALSMAVAAISMLLTKAKITRRFREWLSGRTSFAGRYFHGLFSCPYCMAHPWCLAAALVYDVRVVVSPYYPIDIAVSAALMIVPTSVFSWTIYASVKGMEKGA